MIVAMLCYQNESVCALILVTLSFDLTQPGKNGSKWYQVLPSTSVRCAPCEDASFDCLLGKGLQPDRYAKDARDDVCWSFRAERRNLVLKLVLI